MKVENHGDPALGELERLYLRIPPSKSQVIQHTQDHLYNDLQWFTIIYEDPKSIWPPMSMKLKRL